MSNFEATHTVLGVLHNRSSGVVMRSRARRRWWLVGSILVILGMLLTREPVRAQQQNLSLIVNGAFDSNANGWSWKNINGEGGWRSTGGNPGGNFIINQSGERATDPILCQDVSGLAVGETFELTGDYASFKPQYGSAQKPDAFAATVDGTPVLELPRPSPTPTQWTAFSTDFVAGSEEITLCFVTEREGDDSSFRVDNIALVQTSQRVVAVRPNPFTPNGDGFNDRVEFDLTAYGLLQPRVRIVSFEGRLVWRSDRSDGFVVFWDGRDERGEEQKPGIYLYIIEEGSDVVASGSVVLAR